MDNRDILQMVKYIRDETGISFLDAKKCVYEAGGDKDQALILAKTKDHSFGKLITRRNFDE